MIHIIGWFLIGVALTILDQFYLKRNDLTLNLVLRCFLYSLTGPLYTISMVVRLVREFFNRHGDKVILKATKETE